MLNYISPTQIFTVSFFGHRTVNCFRLVEKRLEEFLIRIINEHEYVDFLVGRNGEFDQLVSSTIRRVKRELCNDNCIHILVLPYNSAQFQNNEERFSDYYDEIEICPESHTAHFKAAIQIRNRKMIDRSDLCVFYVEHNSGGAYQSLRYAIKQKRQVVNVATLPDLD